MSSGPVSLFDPYSPTGLPRSISSRGPEDQFFISVQPSSLMVSKHSLPQSLPGWVPRLGTGMGTWRMVGGLRATRGVSLLLFLLRTHGHFDCHFLKSLILSWRSVVLSLGFCPHSPFFHSFIIQQVYSTSTGMVGNIR